MKPPKPTKAFLIKRLPPDVHQLIVDAAAKGHMSMTAWMIRTMEATAKKELGLK